MKKVTGVKKVFSDVVEKLNIISVNAGYFVHTVNQIKYKALSKKELLKHAKKMIKHFQRIEECALEAGDIIHLGKN